MEPCAPGLPDPALSAVPLWLWLSSGDGDGQQGCCLGLVLRVWVLALLWNSLLHLTPSKASLGFRCLSEQKDVR